MSTIQKTPLSVTDALKVVRLNVNAGFGVPEHHSNVDVIVTVVRGSGDFVIEGKTRAIAQGDVIVMKPRERHSIRAASDLELVVVHARLGDGATAASCGA